MFCNGLREGRPRGALGELFVKFIKCWKFSENHINVGIQLKSRDFGVFLRFWVLRNGGFSDPLPSEFFAISLGRIRGQAQDAGDV